LALLREVGARHHVGADRWLPTHVNRQGSLLEEGLAWARAGGTIDFTTSTTPAFLADGEVAAAEALARMLDAGVDVARVGLSSDGQASLPHFDADGRLRSLAVAPIASLLEAVREAVQRHGVALGTALAAATSTPADAWGLAAKGRLRAGGDADVLLLRREDLALLGTFASGRFLDLG
jgi:beta-aspartyl-dipeptidase (metallo-type)